MEENAEVQYQHGENYYDGTNGVQQDYIEALKWYRKAAEQGLAKAQNTLGWMYNVGKGTVKDEAEGVKWYRRAAEQGYAKAQRNLGFAYINGTGIAI